MNELKTRCATCGTSIQKRTAERNFGLCAPCYRRAVSKPPDTFQMPRDLVQRIVSMDEDPENYREAMWRDGPASVHQRLDALDDTAAAYRRWSPALRAFAADCRQTSPAPRIESLAAAARAQYRVLCTKMREFAESKDGLVTLAARPHHLAVLSTNRVGLAAAEDVFGGSGAVILEESERLYWFAEVYEDHQAALWWYAFAWWTFEDIVVGKQPEPIRRRVSALPGSSCWVLKSGVQWGPLAGGGRSELWEWDGERATFIEEYETVQF